MKEQFELLESSAKRRFIIFAVITVIAALFAVGYAREIYTGYRDAANATGGTDVTIDGADFSPLFGLMTAGVNGFVTTVMLFSTAAFQFIGNLIAFGLFRLLAFRNVPAVSREEYALAKRMQFILLIAGGIAALIAAHFELLLYIAVLLVPVWLFGFLFCLLPLKKRMQDTDTI